MVILNALKYMDSFSCMCLAELFFPISSSSVTSVYASNGYKLILTYLPLSNLNLIFYHNSFRCLILISRKKKKIIKNELIIGHHWSFLWINIVCRVSLSGRYMAHINAVYRLFLDRLVRVGTRRQSFWTHGTCADTCNVS